MISGSLVFRAAGLKQKGTFDWDDELRDDGKDFAASFVEKVMGA